MMWVDLLTKQHRIVLENYSEEAFGAAVLDCGCSENVCRAHWIVTCIEALSEEQRKYQEEKPMELGARFGEIQAASKVVTVPGELAEQKCIFTI